MDVSVSAALAGNSVIVELVIMIDFSAFIFPEPTTLTHTERALARIPIENVKRDTLGSM